MTGKPFIAPPPTFATLPLSQEGNKVAFGRREGLIRDHSHAKFASGQLRALDPCLDLAERDVAGSGGVIGERSESTVISSSELLDG
jgi:hypothetical protein